MVWTCAKEGAPATVCHGGKAGTPKEKQVCAKEGETERSACCRAAETDSGSLQQSNPHVSIAVLDSSVTFRGHAVVRSEHCMCVFVKLCVCVCIPEHEGVGLCVPWASLCVHVSMCVHVCQYISVCLCISISVCGCVTL